MPLCSLGLKPLDQLDIAQHVDVQQEEAEAARRLAEVAASPLANLEFVCPWHCSAAARKHAQEEAEAARRKAEVCM